jgi:hypothetical protein
MDGALTVTRRPITVTARDEIKVVGTADPPLAFRVSSGSLVGADGLMGAPERLPGEQPGAYAITQGTLTVSPNYVLTFVGGRLVIGPPSFNTAGTLVQALLTPGWPEPGTRRARPHRRDTGRERPRNENGCASACAWLPHPDNRDLGQFVRFARP